MGSDSHGEPMRLRDVVGYSSSSTPPRPLSPALSSSPEIALRDQLLAAAQPADSPSPAKRKATTDANGGSPKRPKQSPSSDADVAVTGAR